MKKFLKEIGTWLLKSIVIMAVVSIGGSAVLYYMSSRPPKIADGSTLYLEMDRPLVDSPGIPNSPFFKLLSGSRSPELAAMLVADALRAAGRDSRIDRVVLDLDQYRSSGPQTVEDVTSAIEEVRRSGKPVYAYGANYDRSTYRIAAAATKAFVGPLGQVDLSGPEVGQLYLGDLLKRLGVDIRVARAGRYKSAIEPFELGAMSADARASLSGLVEGHQAQFAEVTARNRGMSAGEFQRRATAIAPTAIASGGDVAGAATRLGLIDGAATQLDFENLLSGAKAGIPARRGPMSTVVTIDDYMRAVEAPKCELADRVEGRGGMIAIVPLAGEITMNEQAPGSISPNKTLRVLRQIRTSGKTAAVVLRIDSPGGDVQASEIIRQEVLALRQSGIPVIASLGNTAASGGYWIASAADEIVAGRFTTTGSIGVFAVVPSLNRIATKNQVYPQVVRAGPDPLGPNLIEPATQQQLAMLDANVSGLYTWFLRIVAEARGMSTAAVDEVAQGRVWTGAQAVELKLADRVGTLETAVDRAAARGRTSRDCKALLPRTVGFQEALNLVGGQRGPMLPGSQTIAGLTALLSDRPGRAMAYCALCATVR